MCRKKPAVEALRERAIRSQPFSYDFDNDGWPDIYIAVDWIPQHPVRRTIATEHSPMLRSWPGFAFNQDGEEQSGMGVAIGDYDCDGWLDIFKTNFSDESPGLYTTIAATEHSPMQHWPQGSAAIDNTWAGAVVLLIMTTTAGRT